jgi:hypothetical protein
MNTWLVSRGALARLASSSRNEGETFSSLFLFLFLFLFPFSCHSISSSTTFTFHKNKEEGKKYNEHFRKSFWMRKINRFDNVFCTGHFEHEEAHGTWVVDVKVDRCVDACALDALDA